jgi:hypothetical protein
MEKPSDWDADLDPTTLPDTDTRWSDLVANSFDMMNAVMTGKRTCTEPEFQAACWVISSYQQRLLNHQIDICAEQKLQNFLEGDVFGARVRDIMNHALVEAGTDIKIPEGLPVRMPGIIGIQMPPIGK